MQQTSMDFHLMRNDLLLSYRVDQLLQLFPDTKTNHDASSIIKDKNGAGLWKTSFGSKVKKSTLRWLEDVLIMLFLKFWIDYYGSFSEFL